MNNVINTPFNSSKTDSAEAMTKTYEVKLNLTAEQISEILDYRLGQKIEHENGDFEELLNTAECIKPDNLNEEFCRFFTAELTPLVYQLISTGSDSYEVTNFQHRMLRKFSDCAATKRTA